MNSPRQSSRRSNAPTAVEQDTRGRQYVCDHYGWEATLGSLDAIFCVARDSDSRTRGCIVSHAIIGV